MSGRLADAYDAFLLDLDGTVYRGSEPVPNAAEAVEALRRDGRRIGFVTNNASRAPEAVARRLTGLGIDAHPSEVRTSAQAAARVLAEQLDAGAKVLVVGTDALADELTTVGLTPVRGADGVVAVVQGLSEDTGWRDLAEAVVAIRAGARWVACNVDPTLPTERGLLPGNGSLVAAVRTATSAEPAIAGKPGRPLLDDAVAATAPNALVVGDRLDTDIAGAHAAGLDSLFVLTGVSTVTDLLAAPERHRPSYLATDLACVTDPVDALRIGAGEGWQVTVDGGNLRAAGDGSPVALVRALCTAWWPHGGTPERIDGDERAAAALGELGLGRPPSPTAAGHRIG